MAFIVFFVHNPFWWLGVAVIVFSLGGLARMLLRGDHKL